MLFRYVTFMLIKLSLRSGHELAGRLGSRSWLAPRYLLSPDMVSEVVAAEIAA